MLLGDKLENQDDESSKQSRSKSEGVEYGRRSADLLQSDSVASVGRWGSLLIAQLATPSSLAGAPVRSSALSVHTLGAAHRLASSSSNLSRASVACDN
jgi:hypothetical protein